MKTWHFLFAAFLLSCTADPEKTTASLQSILQEVESIEGRSEYLTSPYVTAGDRLYVAGHQDGTFPDIGWHVQGEMGGVWAHPVKLMDGFTVWMMLEDTTYCLPAAEQFRNYPMASRLDYPELAGTSISQMQFVPDTIPGVVVEYAVTNHGNTATSITLIFEGRTDLRPVWLGERTGMEDHPDSLWYDETVNALVGKDQGNPWYVFFGSALTPSSHGTDANCLENHMGMGKEASLEYELDLGPGETVHVPFVIAGSSRSPGVAREYYLEIRENNAQMLIEKKRRYERIAETTSLEIPDQQLEQTFRWLKYNTDWLIRDVEGVGRGLSAGIPDYPWWFGADSEYALQGALMTGQRDLVYETIDLLVSISDSVNGNGRIVHEVSSNGAVFNPGNINETPQFASLVWKVYNWTGNRDFLEKYYPVVADGLEWLMAERDADGNFLPDGFGMMEIHGLDSEMIDVAAYTQKAFSDAAKMAGVLGREEESAGFREKAERLARIINSDFWVEEQQSYADFIGTVGQARHLIREAIHRADSLEKPWAVAELRKTLSGLEDLPADEKRAFVVYHNWVVNTPMETGVADPDKALKALETGNRFTNPFGMYVTGIDRDEAADEDAGSFVTNKKIFSYIGAVMTLPTGVQAVAENNYGRPDQALDYLKRMSRSFSYALPGSMYEVSPDYGMMVQAWNIYAFAVPVVEQFFGIHPDAAQNLIQVSPQMPSSWPEASLSRVPVLDGALTIKYTTDRDGVILEIDFTGQAAVQLAFSTGMYARWEVDGEAVQPEQFDGKDALSLTPGRHQVKLN